MTIENTFQQEVQIATTLQKGCARLQSGEYSAVLLDQWISEAEPTQTDVLFEYIGAAIPLFVNFGISGEDRILRELRAALFRRERETILARHGARLTLRSELTDEVTALLLCCGIALREPALTESVATRLRTIEEVANQIKNKLATSEDNERAFAART